MEDSSSLHSPMQAESTLAFPRDLLDFNVTLIGTNTQFQNGNSDDSKTLDTARQVLEEFLLGGYLNMTAPVSDLTLELDGRSQLFPGSLIHTFRYSGTLFVWQLESNWNTYKVQQYQEGLLKDRESDIGQLFKRKGISLLVDAISVTPFDPSNQNPSEDNDNQIRIEDFPKYKKAADSSTTSTYVTIAGTVAFFAFLAFVFFLKKKSAQIKLQRESDRESRKRRISDDGAIDMESANMEVDTGSDHSMPS